MLHFMQQASPIRCRKGRKRSVRYSNIISSLHLLKRRKICLTSDNTLISEAHPRGGRVFYTSWLFHHFTLKTQLESFVMNIDLFPAKGLLHTFIINRWTFPYYNTIWDVYNNIIKAVQLQYLHDLYNLWRITVPSINNAFIQAHDFIANAVGSK